jgi:hypothetical protein
MMTLLTILGGAMLARFLIRARMRRMWAYGLGYGGCGRFRRRAFQPIDLSAPDRFEELPRTTRREWRWQPWERNGAAARPALDVPSALELNERQKELYDQVMLKAAKHVPAAALAEALIAVGREPFGRDAIELLVGPGELADDFEQLHHSLTSEQRQKLREVTAA